MAGPTTTGVILTESAAAKVKKISDAFDQRRKNLRGRPSPSGPIENEIWGLLTGCDLSGKRYSFVRVTPDASGDDTDVIINGGNIGFNIVVNDANPGQLFTAYEVNGAIGATMQIVRLTFAGYRKDPTTGDKLPVFVFQYEQMNPNLPLPIHDHRDNLPGSGGFAFAVYAPGTALPQSAWRP
jgi:hypothetical protein